MRRLLPLLVPIAACAGPADDPVGAGADEVVAERVVESTALPIAEVSGLGQRRIGGAVEHLAAGAASCACLVGRDRPSRASCAKRRRRGSLTPALALAEEMVGCGH